MLTYPYRYLIIENNSEIDLIKTFLKTFLGNRIEIKTNEYITIYYDNFDEHYLKEGLTSLNNEGLVEIKAYCSNLILNQKEMDIEYPLMEKAMTIAPKGIYNSRDLLPYLVKSKINHNIVEYILKKYSTDEEMKLILKTMFTCDLNVSKAATVLYMHRNTLMYKLDRFKEVTGYDIRHFKDAHIIATIL